MKRFVLDASVTLGWILDDPVPTYAHNVRNMLRNGVEAVVPALWHLEIANALSGATRRGLISRGDSDATPAQLSHLVRLSIGTDTDLVPIHTAFEIADRFRLAAYDAAYLHAAMKARLPLATLDPQLRSAAKQAHVPLVS